MSQKRDIEDGDIYAAGGDGDIYADGAAHGVTQGRSRESHLDTEGGTRVGGPRDYSGHMQPPRGGVQPVMIDQIRSGTAIRGMTAIPTQQVGTARRVLGYDPQTHVGPQRVMLDYKPTQWLGSTGIVPMPWFSVERGIATAGVDEPSRYRNTIDAIKAHGRKGHLPPPTIIGLLQRQAQAGSQGAVAILNYIQRLANAIEAQNAERR